MEIKLINKKISVLHGKCCLIYNEVIKKNLWIILSTYLQFYALGVVMMIQIKRWNSTKHKLSNVSSNFSSFWLRTLVKMHTKLSNLKLNSNFLSFPTQIPKFTSNPPQPYHFKHHHIDNKKRRNDKSWLDMINPFECESDYEDDDGDDYGD